MRKKNCNNSCWHTTCLSSGSHGLLSYMSCTLRSPPGPRSRCDCRDSLFSMSCCRPFLCRLPQVWMPLLLPTGSRPPTILLHPKLLHLLLPFHPLGPLLSQSTMCSLQCFQSPSRQLSFHGGPKLRSHFQRGRPWGALMLSRWYKLLTGVLLWYEVMDLFFQSCIYHC